MDPRTPNSIKHGEDMVEDLEMENVRQNNGITHQSSYSDLSVWKTLITFRRALGYTLLVATALMLEGFEVVVTSSIIVNAGFRAQFGTKLVNGVPMLDPGWVSAWGAIVNVGQIVSMTYVAYFANRFGRKPTLILAWLLMSMSLAFATGARIPAVWLLGRFFTGMGLGIMQVTVVPYKIEIVPNKIRGITAVFGTVWSGVGGLICSIMMQQTNKRYPTFYQLPLYIAWGPMAGVLICLALIPESPWYYARHGRKEQALEVMGRIYRGIPGYDAEDEYQIIIETLQHEKAELERQNSGSWRDVCSGQNKRRFLTVVMVILAAMLGGVTLVQSYQTYFFFIAGLEDPFLAAVIQTSIGLGTIITFAFITDNFGRRLPVCIGYTVMSISLWLIGGLWYVESKAAGPVLVTLASFWISAFTVLGNTGYLFQAELPSAHLRVKTGSIVFVIQAVLGIGMNFAVPYLLEVANTRAAFLFGATSLPICILFWFFLPETKARSPAEIDELFESKVPAYRWKKYVTEVERNQQGSSQVPELA